MGDDDSLELWFVTNDHLIQHLHWAVLDMSDIHPSALLLPETEWKEANLGLSIALYQKPDLRY